MGVFLGSWEMLARQCGRFFGSWNVARQCGSFLGSLKKLKIDVLDTPFSKKG